MGSRVSVVEAERAEVAGIQAGSIVAAATFTASSSALLITRLLLHPQSALIGRVLPTSHSQIASSKHQSQARRLTVL